MDLVLSSLESGSICSSIPAWMVGPAVLTWESWVLFIKSGVLQKVLLD